MQYKVGGNALGMQQRLVNTGGRLLTHAVTIGCCSRKIDGRTFGGMLGKVAALPSRGGTGRKYTTEHVR